MTKPTSDSITPDDMTNPNPNSSSHPTSLEAQAEKSGHAESVGRYHAWLKTEFPPIREDKQWLGEAASLSAWYTQDRHYVPIVEALKAEVEELKKENDEINQKMETYLQSDARIIRDNESLRKQIEQLTAELERAKKDLNAHELFEAGIVSILVSFHSTIPSENVRREVEYLKHLLNPEANP